jgi:hypothetical protein
MAYRDFAIGGPISALALIQIAVARVMLALVEWRTRVDREASA